MDAATAGNAIGTWSSSFGESIDVVVLTTMEWECYQCMVKDTTQHSDTMPTVMQ